MTKCVQQFGLWLVNQELVDFAEAQGFDGKLSDFDGYNFSAKATGTFLDNGDHIFNGINFDGKTLRYRDIAMVFPAEKQPSPYAAAYHNKNEVIAEFKERYGKFLPKDFDYSGHIGTYQYCMSRI